MVASSSKAGKTGESLQRSRGIAEHALSFQLATTGTAKAKPIAVALPAGTFKTLSSRPGLMTTLIETYGAALERSRLSGQPVRFVVDVTPSGEQKITPVEDEAKEAPADAHRAGSDLPAALAAARERGRLRVAEILGGPDMLNADEFANLIGTSRMTVNAKRQKHQVLGLEGAKRGFRFPKWQIGDDGRPFPALPALFDRFEGSPWAVYRFLVQHHPELNGRTGREALRHGDDAAVIAASESVIRDFA